MVFVSLPNSVVKRWNLLLELWDYPLMSDHYRNIATIDIQPLVSGIGFTDDDMLSVHLVDGRIVLVPLEWYPRLMNATVEERQDWRVFEDSDERDIIFWESLDELVPAIALLTGIPSRETDRSLQKWLSQRDNG